MQMHKQITPHAYDSNRFSSSTRFRITSISIGLFSTVSLACLVSFQLQQNVSIDTIEFITVASIERIPFNTQHFFALVCVCVAEQMTRSVGAYFPISAMCERDK